MIDVQLGSQRNMRHYLKDKISIFKEKDFLIKLDKNGNVNFCDETSIKSVIEHKNENKETVSKILLILNSHKQLMQKLQNYDEETFKKKVSKKEIEKAIIVRNNIIRESKESLSESLKNEPTINNDTDNMRLDDEYFLKDLRNEDWVLTYDIKTASIETKNIFGISEVIKINDSMSRKEPTLEDLFFNLNIDFKESIKEEIEVKRKDFLSDDQQIYPRRKDYLEEFFSQCFRKELNCSLFAIRDLKEGYFYHMKKAINPFSGNIESNKVEFEIKESLFNDIFDLWIFKSNEQHYLNVKNYNVHNFPSSLNIDVLEPISNMNESGIDNEQLKSLLKFKNRLSKEDYESIEKNLDDLKIKTNLFLSKFGFKDHPNDLSNNKEEILNFIKQRYNNMNLSHSYLYTDISKIISKMTRVHEISNREIESNTHLTDQNNDRMTTEQSEIEFIQKKEKIKEKIHLTTKQRNNFHLLKTKSSLRDITSDFQLSYFDTIAGREFCINNPETIKKNNKGLDSRKIMEELLLKAEECIEKDDVVEEVDSKPLTSVFKVNPKKSKIIKKEQKKINKINEEHIFSKNHFKKQNEEILNVLKRQELKKKEYDVYGNQRSYFPHIRSLYKDSLKSIHMRDPKQFASTDKMTFIAESTQEDPLDNTKNPHLSHKLRNQSPHKRIISELDFANKGSSDKLIFSEISIYPIILNFGKLKEGELYKTRFSILNQSRDPIRVTVKPPIDFSAISIIKEEGPFAPGLNKYIDVVFNTKNISQGNIFKNIKISFPKGTINYEVRAKIVQNKNEVDSVKEIFDCVSNKTQEDGFKICQIKTEENHPHNLTLYYDQEKVF